MNTGKCFVINTIVKKNLKIKMTMNVEYILRQVEPGHANPLIIHLNEEENFIGRQMIPELTNYVRVSEVHAYIKKRGTEFQVRDLGSINGVYVNGIKIGKELHKLEVGDYLGFGAPSFNYGGFACTFSAKVTSSDERKQKKSAPQEREENPQKKIKQESNELVPETNKFLLENESAISNKLQELEHSEDDGSNVIKIKQEIVETESEDNLKNISFLSVHESSDKLNNHIDEYVPSNYEETSGMGNDHSGIFMSSRHSEKEESKLNNSTDNKLMNKTSEASNPAGISNSVCEPEVKLFNDMEEKIYLSGDSHFGIYIKHVTDSNIPCFIRMVDFNEKNNSNNYENMNIEERNNVGMVSSSRKACDESVRKISDRNQNVGSKGEQDHGMQQISKLEINPSCSSSKVQDSNLINPNEFDKSSSDKWKKSIKKNCEKKHVM